MSATPKIGDVRAARYPFVRDSYSYYDTEAEASAELETWKPGVRFEVCGYYGDDSEARADGEGEIIFTVVDVHKPGKYATRVFLTRQFRDPDGGVFGKPKLHIWTLEKFNRLSRGYQYPYLIGDVQREAA